jgi:hypothetical protein
MFLQMELDMMRLCANVIMNWIGYDKKRNSLGLRQQS